MRDITKVFGRIFFIRVKYTPYFMQILIRLFDFKNDLYYRNCCIKYIGLSEATELVYGVFSIW